MIILKMFGDYYKKGVVSGKLYGTFSGKEIKVAKYNISKQHYRQLGRELRYFASFRPK